jgi:hypothetical protein
MTGEEQRREQSRQRTAHWKRWVQHQGERQWGTVRDPPWATHVTSCLLTSLRLYASLST